MAQTANARRRQSQAQAPAKAQGRPWSHGAFHWNELCTRDVEGAKRFYGEVIGWTFESMPMPDGGTYWTAYQHGKPVGGLVTDKIVVKGLQMLGGFSSTTSSLGIALEILRAHHGRLSPICSHSFRLDQADLAVRTLGREVDDGKEVVHVSLVMRG